MKRILIIIIDAIMAISLFSLAAANISKPSNLYVAVGVFQAILGAVFAYYFFRYIFIKSI